MDSTSQLFSWWHFMSHRFTASVLFDKLGPQTKKMNSELNAIVRSSCKAGFKQKYTQVDPSSP